MFRKIAALLLISLFAPFAQAQTVVIFKPLPPSSQIWICPPGVTSILVECWGAGAPSGGAPVKSGFFTWSGGGGGGAYAASQVTVVPGMKYELIPAPHSLFPTNFHNGTVLAASGQIGEVKDNTQAGFAAGGNGGQASGCKGTVKTSGGDGGRGIAGAGGGGGGSAGPNGPGNGGADGSGATGGAGGTGAAAGGRGQVTIEGDVPAQIGSFPGGGSGGGLSRATPNGGGGMIRISW